MARDDDGAGPSQARPFKRPRVSSYPKGSVLKVEVKNFMTYSHAVIEPGPKLNLLIGPNGSGKSSLVCALCVGLAGKTSLLGRAEDVASFVRRGTQRGWVEITLSSGDPMRPHRVRRELNAADNHSAWYVDGREARMKDVEALVRDRLKVQLDNLCQFLPQDKVVEFARMKPVDLLEATEKAIGNGELFDQHQRLIEVRKELTAHDDHKGALVASLEQLRAENSRNTRDVQNIQLRERLLEQVELAKRKEPWLRFEERRKTYQADKERRNEALRLLETKKAEQAEDEGPLAGRDKLAKQLAKEKQRLEKELRESDQRLVGPPGGKGLEAEMSDALEEAADKETELAGLERDAAERERKIATLAAEVEQLGAQVAALPPAGDTGNLGRQRQQLVLEQRDMRMQEGALGMQLEELQTQCEALQRRRQQARDRIQRMNDSKHRRLQALEGRYRGITNAWRWVQANKGRFRGQVLGPIAVEVDCPDPQHVRYLEQSVNATAWTFFVTQFREDHDLLQAEMRALGYKPSIANYTADPNTPIPHPRGEASEYGRYGISQTLDKVFLAPNVVKKVLCEESRLNEVYIGDANTQVDALFRDNPRIQLVFTPNTCYKRTRSRYNDSAESTLVSDVRPARLLTGASAADEGREKAEAEEAIVQCNHELAGLQGQVEELQGQRAAKKAQLDELQRRLRRIDEEIKAITQQHQGLRMQHKGKQNELERTCKKPDPRKKAPRLAKEAAAARERALKKALELAAVQTAQLDLLLRLAAVDLGMREAQMQCDRIKAAGQARAAELKRYQDMVAQLERLVKAGADECRRLKAHAEQAAELSEELREQWEALPEALPQLQAFIEEKSAEADTLLISNPAALRQYQQRCRDIADQERQLEELEERRELARRTIDDVSAQWLPELQRIVAAVNDTFSANFQHVGCAGDVVLHEAPGEDFEKYAIEIRVKFRESEELQTLDANRQSGGERSVSTILYLIALQGVTVTPFRVVDEINQGMDPVNERKVFVQLVEAACREGTPQCFLLTPKLLPDLPFTRDVAVLQIMNGTHIEQAAKGFSMDKLLGRQRMQQLVAAA